MSNHPRIEVRDIATRFGDREVHQSVSFRVEEPSVVAVIGGSGAGKSVLLKVIIGLLRPSAGSVQLFGKNILGADEDELRDLRRRFGVLFQNGALFSSLDVERNAALPFREQLRLPQNVADSLAALKLGLSGLEPEVFHQMPSELSGGMRKRAALARALALDPEILFLDEPTSGLDPINARAFDELVRTLCDSLGLTVFMITHDLDTLGSIVDRIIVLGEGKVLADGTLDEVRNVDHPWIESYFSSRPK